MEVMAMATKTYRVRVDVRGFLDLTVEAASADAAEKEAMRRVGAGEYSPDGSAVRITGIVGKARAS